jgi:hypothetical protein
MMTLRPIPSRRLGGRIVAACFMDGVVGCVRQVDPKAHPYPPHLLLGPAGTPGLASRSGSWARARQSPVEVLGWSLGTDPASNRSYSRGHGPWSSRPYCQLELWAEVARMKLSPHADGRLFHVRPWAGQGEVSPMWTPGP